MYLDVVSISEWRMDCSRWLNCAWMAAMRTLLPFAHAATVDAASIRSCGAVFAASQPTSRDRSLNAVDFD